jgi:hypothetical protein
MISGELCSSSREFGITSSSSVTTRMGFLVGA